MALISSELQEVARDGKTVAELRLYGATILHRQDLMEGVPEMIDEIRIEASFPDGTRLVTVHQPMVGLGCSGISFFKTEKLERYIYALGGATLLVCRAGMVFLQW